MEMHPDIESCSLWFLSRLIFVMILETWATLCLELFFSYGSSSPQACSSSSSECHVLRKKWLAFLLVMTADLLIFNEFWKGAPHFDVGVHGYNFLTQIKSQESFSSNKNCRRLVSQHMKLEVCNSEINRQLRLICNNFG